MKNRQQLYLEMGALMYNLRVNLTSEIIKNFRGMMFNLEITYDHLKPGFVAEITKNNMPLENIEEAWNYAKFSFSFED